MEHLYIKCGDPSNGGFFLDIVRINRHSQMAAKNVPLDCRQSGYKTDVTPAILSRDFVAQLYRATKLQYATVHVAHCNFVA